MTAEEVSRLLIEIGAIELRERSEDWFTWASGRRAPIYCDNRALLAFPEARARVAGALADAIRADYPSVEVVAGTATAGIPHAAWVAERLDLPMVYVRSSTKEHGKQRRVEGCKLSGQRVVLIEDLISFGGSAAAAVDALHAEGGKVLGVQAIFSYGFPEADRKLADSGVPWRALSGYETLLDTLELDPITLRALREWRER